MSHQLGVYIIVVVVRPVLDSEPNLFSVEQTNVKQNGRQRRETQAIGKRERRREEKGRVLVVGGLVQREVWKQDLGDVVRLRLVVVADRIAHREVLAVQNSTVVHADGHNPEDCGCVSIEMSKANPSITYKRPCQSACWQ